MGHGRVGKHRDHPGGRGNVGGFQHHKILFNKYHPGHFGRVGAKFFHLKKNQLYCPSMNIDKLWTLVSEVTYKEAKEGKSEKKIVIDIGKAGYSKLLGKGELPKIPVVVKAKLFSKEAERKIKEVGGACILTA